MAGSLSQRPERASQNTGSPSYKHPHCISFLLGWTASSRPGRAMNAHLWMERRTQRAAATASRTSAGWPMLLAGHPGNDGRVEIRMSLDTIDPPRWNLSPGGACHISRLAASMPAHLCCELGPGGDVQLGEHVCEMRLYCPARYVQAL